MASGSYTPIAQLKAICPRPQSEPVEGPMGDPQAPAEQGDPRAPTVPAPPPTEPMTDCEDEP